MSRGKALIAFKPRRFTVSSRHGDPFPFAPRREVAYAKSISPGIIMFTTLARRNGSKKTSNLLDESRGTIRVPVFCDEESSRSDRGGSLDVRVRTSLRVKPSVANKGEARQNNVIDSLIFPSYHFGDSHRFHAYLKLIESTRD